MEGTASNQIANDLLETLRILFTGTATEDGSFEGRASDVGRFVGMINNGLRPFLPPLVQRIDGLIPSLLRQGTPSCRRGRTASTIVIFNG